MTAPMPLPMPLLDRRQRLFAWVRRHQGWLSFVALPTLLAALYFGVVASDLYASEARFVVRSPSRVPTVGLAGLLQTTGIGGGHDDVYTVQDFATSRDALGALSKKIDLRALFGRPEADWFSRYPNLLDDSTAEDFHRYYQSRVQVVFDTTTGISTLTVKAFRPEDAQALARLLLDESEALVNRLNQRARGNAVRDAEEEVRLAQEQAELAEAQVLGYRNRESLLDPGESSGAMLKGLASLQAEVSNARVRLSEIEVRAPDSPMRADLQSRIAALERQIGKERAKLAGNDGSMAPKIAEYEMLILRQTFAAKLLGSTLASLESARAESRRQQIYLARVVEPSLPDKAAYPKRLRTVFTAFISFFLAYVICKFLLAGMREHAQI